MSSGDWGANARSRVEKALARARKTVEDKRGSGARRNSASSGMESTSYQSAEQKLASRASARVRELPSATGNKARGYKPNSYAKMETKNALEAVEDTETSLQEQNLADQNTEDLSQQLRNLKAEQNLMEAEAQMMVTAVEDENKRLREEIQRLQGLADTEAQCYRDQIAALKAALESRKSDVIVDSWKARLAKHVCIAMWRAQLRGTMLDACRAIAYWSENWRWASKAAEQAAPQVHSLDVRMMRRCVQGESQELAALRARLAMTESQLAQANAARHHLEDELARFQSDFLTVHRDH